MPFQMALNCGDSRAYPQRQQKSHLPQARVAALSMSTRSRESHATELQGVQKYRHIEHNASLHLGLCLLSGIEIDRRRAMQVGPQQLTLSGLSPLSLLPVFLSQARCENSGWMKQCQQENESHEGKGSQTNHRGINVPASRLSCGNL